MRGLRSFVLRAGLVVLGAAAAFALGEAAARLLVPAASVSELRGLHQYRPDRGWLYGLRPGAEGRLSETGDALYRINPDGSRGPRHARPKPGGVKRVVVMGDSIAFGYGVEEASAFPRLLESEIAALAPETDVEVVNLGVGGYNAWNEAELLKDVGVSYQPDLVLVQFCINDLNEPSVHFDAQTRLLLSSIPDAAYPDPSLRRAPYRAPSWILGWCAASRLCAQAHDLWLGASQTGFDDAARRAAVQPIESGGETEWRWLEARYLEMAAAAEHTGAGFAVLAFPYPQQVTRSGPDPVQEKLVAMARRNRWTLIDPLPAFRTAHDAGTRLFLDWWHPTVAGHRLAAVETLRVLACSGTLGLESRDTCGGGADERASGG